MLRRTILAALVAAGWSVGALAQQGPTLTMGVRAGPESVDPHWSTLGGHIEALRHVFESLVAQDEQLNLKPGLAVSWTPVDETTWEFKLRDGVKFHDGSDFTAEDVKFSLERIPVVTGPMSMTLYTKRAKSATVVDRLTVRFTTDGPAPTLPNDFARLMIVSRNTGMEARNEHFNSGEKAIGTGPFKFVKWEPRGDFVVERFDGYWGGRQPWARVVRKEIPNDAARLASLKSGQVDLINYVPATDVASLQKDPSMEVVVGDSVYVFNVYLNVRDKLPKPVRVDGKEIEANPMADLRVRQAMDLGIDRRALARVVFEGLAKPMSQLMPDNFFGASPNLPERRPDLPRARQLLAEAGYPKGFRDRLLLHQQPPAGRRRAVRGAGAAMEPDRAEGEPECGGGHGVLPGQHAGRLQHADVGLGHADGRGGLHVWGHDPWSGPVGGFGQLQPLGLQQPGGEQAAAGRVADAGRRAAPGGVRAGDGDQHERSSDAADRDAADGVGDAEGQAGLHAADGPGDAGLRDRAARGGVGLSRLRVAPVAPLPPAPSREGRGSRPALLRLREG